MQHSLKLGGTNTILNCSKYWYHPILKGIPAVNSNMYCAVNNTTGKLYHLKLLVECTFFCNLQSRARNHALLVIGLYELLGNPTT